MTYMICIACVYLIKLYCARVLEQKDKVLARKICIFLSFGVFFLISSLRGIGVGIDTQNYVNKFNLIQSYSLTDILTSVYTERVEFGYAALNKLVGLIFGDAQAMIALNSFVVCFGMAWFVYHYTDSDITGVILMICCGLFLQSLNVSRQIMAVVVLMNAWGALTKGKLAQSLVLFAVAFSFHITSAIFVIAYVFYFFRANKRMEAVLLCVGFFGIVFFEPVLHLIAAFVSFFDKYLKNEGLTVNASGIWVIWAIELAVAVFFLLDYFFGKRLRCRLPFELPRFKRSVQICVPTFVILYIAFTFIGTRFNFFDRFGMYFMGFTVPLLLEFERVVKSLSDKLHKVYRFGIHAGFVGYFWLCSRAAQYQYQFFWIE